MSNKKRWLFSSRERNGDTPQQHPKAAPTPKWYQSIDKLPMSRFIDAICDNNIHALTISGTPPIDSLMQSWGSIFEDFTEEIGDQEMKLHKNLSYEFHTLKFKYEQTLVLIDALSQFRHQSAAPLYREMVVDLNTLLRTSLTFSHTDEGFERMLQNARTRSGAMLINLELKKATFEAMQAKQSEAGPKMDRRYFTAQFIALSDHAKYPVTERITVREYCTRIKNINVFLEQQNKANGRGPHK